MIALGSCTRVVGCWWEIVSGNCRHAVGKPQKQELGMHAELMCAYIVRRVKRAPTEWTYIAVLVVLWQWHGVGIVEQFGTLTSRWCKARCVPL